MKDFDSNILNKEDLVKIFKEVGISQGMILEVHSSLKTFGMIVGGAETFIDALLEVVGYNGTLVMMCQNPYNNEPANFRYPPLVYELHQKYRDGLKAFNPKTTEISFMSKALENLRRREKAEFSNHPSCAVCAIGRYAKYICESQNLDFALDDNSPIGKLYDLKAYCLLAGVDYDKMTSLHLAEYKSEVRPIMIEGTKVKDDKWQKRLEIDLDSDDGFKEVGKILEDRGLVRIKDINDAKLKLLKVDTAVLEASKYFKDRIRKYEVK